MVAQTMLYLVHYVTSCQETKKLFITILWQCTILKCHHMSPEPCARLATSFCQHYKYIWAYLAEIYSRNIQFCFDDMLAVFESSYNTFCKMSCVICHRKALNAELDGILGIPWPTHYTQSCCAGLWSLLLKLDLPYYPFLAPLSP